MENPIYATNSTSGLANNRNSVASTVTSANVVKNSVTLGTTAQKGASEVYGLQPKYLHHNLWEDNSALSPTTAEWSEQAQPLPHVPFSEVLNPITSKTISDNPALF
jgi:hypothetical protein